MSRNKLRKYRHDDDIGDLPYEAVLGRMVSVTRNGQRYVVTAEEAFILYLNSRANGKDVSAAILLEEEHSERQNNAPPRGVSTIIRHFVAPGGVNHSLKLLRTARKVERYTKQAHMRLEPWIVETALARLGDRRLSKEEQRTVLAVTRTPHKVKWPRWWTERPPA